MFSDLAGFTTIAERFDPETVAAIVNRHLSEMTAIILDLHGTVDKFIGDGIMAFWGAPISDERQSENAVRAAIEMQKRMDTTSAEIAAETGAVLRMRIGINRGPCIVGNMGGSGRFDYTVIGDTINLASRMEGVNKAYGTRILVSESVVAAVNQQVRFREVDTVRVKGKLVGIKVFTPCDDETLIGMSDDALAAYRAGKFEDAERLWKRLLDAYPEDPVATAGIARISDFRAGGWPAAWDGITTLEEK
jgi:adenylate cyclase